MRLPSPLAGTGPVFEREHHRRIARVLESLDPDLLRTHGCWFGGGTAIALRRGEFRQSHDIDFLVSDPARYRELRQLMRTARDLAPLSRAGCQPLALEDGVRIDRYGIRGFVRVDPVRIKFEIVSEGRICLDVPARSDVLCGIATLSSTDLAACKLLANSDRWADDSVFGRDAIDLAMLDLPPRRLAPAMDKARAAYGIAVANDMHAALHGLRERPGWLQRCMAALSIHLPPAALQQKLRQLSRRLTAVAGHVE